MTSRAALARAALVLASLAASRDAKAEADEELVDDPTLHVAASAPPPAAAPAPKRIWHAEVVGRASTQARWDAGEDVMELRARARLWAEDRPSRELSWAIGVRFDSLSRTKRDAGRFVDGAYTFEARPWEAWVDVALAERLRLRVGNQIVAWGRLDLASAADVMAVRDLREGPMLDPDALRVPTPTLRMTWLAGERGSLEVAYTPFFTADRFDVAGTNWSMIGPHAPGSASALGDKLRFGLDATSFARVQDQLLVVGAPPARPDAGDVGARGVLSLGGVDFGLTYGFVRSKVPALSIDPALSAYLATGGLAESIALKDALDSGRALVDASYDRYHQLALDAEGVLGPFTLSGEVGFTPSRPLYLVDPATGLPEARRGGLAQAGTKVAWVHGDDMLLSLEGGVLALTSAPPEGRRYLLLGDRRTLSYALATLHAEPFDRHELDLAATATSSEPWSLVTLGRWLYRVSEPVAVGVGGAAFAGPRSAEPTVAAVTRGLDEVYLYVRLRP